MSKDRLWQEYFADRSLWWDNRGKKVSGRKLGNGSPLSVLQRADINVRCMGVYR